MFDKRARAAIRRFAKNVSLNATAVPKADRGIALVAAILGLFVFSLLAYRLLAEQRGATLSAMAELDRARLAAAADAGVATTIAGLISHAADSHASVDGRVQELSFDGMRVQIRIAEEDGKIPLNSLTEDQVKLMFESAGVSGERLQTLADSLLDWIDDDDDSRKSGAEAPFYAPFGFRPRNGALRTVSELRALKGMDDPLFQRLAPAVTVSMGGGGGFDAAASQPLALAVMEGGGINSPVYLERLKEMQGQRPDIELGTGNSYLGRVFSITADASDSRDGHFTRSLLVQPLSGSYLIRWQQQ